MVEERVEHSVLVVGSQSAPAAPVPDAPQEPASHRSGQSSRDHGDAVLHLLFHHLPRAPLCHSLPCDQFGGAGILNPSAH